MVQMDPLGMTPQEADADLRTAILAQSKKFSEDLNDLSDRFDSALQDAVTELRGDKLDTATMIQLLSDMALTLSEDLQTGSEQEQA